MKRSQVNDIMREADAFIRSFRIALPPFAYWTPAQMKERKAAIAAEASAISLCGNTSSLWVARYSSSIKPV